MELNKHFGRFFASAGRLLDFGGSYSREYLRKRLSQPGWLRDREAFQADRSNLQSDVNRVVARIIGRSHG